MEIIKYSNIGCREINQDCLASLSFDHDKSIHIVADGIGGYDCGEIASKIVCESYIHGLVNNLSIDEVTKEVSRNIQTECRNLGVSKMGSTVAAVVLNGLQASIFWAGDSRVYVFRDKHLLYQTEDHSLLNELSRVRELSFDEKKRYKHIITRSIMGNADDKVDHDNLELCFGDEILICTDGMYNEYPIDYLIESIRMDKLDIEKKNDSFTDNHSFIYILL
ncbi:protein phosphatase 2C domain-containing protein [Butyricimonas virosa]|uniref:Serine/threonine-protein phosphatase n=1 Tax=Butyricimonas virosa TaxID=544645 RepID=A0ABX7H4M2_9BACT|nr:protein phosphatase 2C domain-containing protein [Butyricimonas virosa]QRO48539.1 serine/threonine-protein phosphatase [Butyricimonas virosa]UWO47094.1 protein phosphatase 2C domain-containing protein [Butyricimonas virosa]